MLKSRINFKNNNFFNDMANNLTERNNNNQRYGHYLLTYNNNTTGIKDNSTNDYSCKSERFLSPSTKSVNFEEMIERFKNEEKKRKSPRYGVRPHR